MSNRSESLNRTLLVNGSTDLNSVIDISTLPLTVTQFGPRRHLDYYRKALLIKGISRTKLAPRGICTDTRHPRTSSAWYVPSIEIKHAFVISIIRPKSFRAHLILRRGASSC